MIDRTSQNPPSFLFLNLTNKQPTFSYISKCLHVSVVFEKDIVKIGRITNAENIIFWLHVGFKYILNHILDEKDIQLTEVFKKIISLSWKKKLFTCMYVFVMYNLCGWKDHTKDDNCKKKIRCYDSKNNYHVYVIRT